MPVVFYIKASLIMYSCRVYIYLYFVFLYVLFLPVMFIHLSSGDFTFFCIINGQFSYLVLLFLLLNLGRHLGIHVVK